MYQLRFQISSDAWLKPRRDPQLEALLEICGGVAALECSTLPPKTQPVIQAFPFWKTVLQVEHLNLQSEAVLASDTNSKPGGILSISVRGSRVQPNPPSSLNSAMPLAGQPGHRTEYWNLSLAAMPPMLRLEGRPSRSPRELVIEPPKLVQNECEIWG